MAFVDHFGGECDCADRTLSECGCVAHVYSDGSGVDIQYCRLHRAAPELRAALRQIRNLPHQTEETAWTWRDLALKMREIARDALGED